MPTFNAQTQLEPLDYDFRPYHDSHGTVPEPSDDMVADFYAALSHQLRLALPGERTADVDFQDPMQVGNLFASLDADDNRLLYEALLGMHADVCGGSPSREALEALPHRLRRAFYGALQGWLRPEA